VPAGGPIALHTVSSAAITTAVANGARRRHSNVAAISVPSTSPTPRDPFSAGTQKNATSTQIQSVRNAGARASRSRGTGRT
jgi:hypothetical protein